MSNDQIEEVRRQAREMLDTIISISDERDRLLQKVQELEKEADFFPVVSFRTDAGGVTWWRVLTHHSIYAGGHNANRQKAEDEANAYADAYREQLKRWRAMLDVGEHDL